MVCWYKIVFFVILFVCLFLCASHWFVCVCVFSINQILLQTGGFIHEITLPAVFNFGSEKLKKKMEEVTRCEGMLCFFFYFFFVPALHLFKAIIADLPNDFILKHDTFGFKKKHKQNPFFA